MSDRQQSAHHWKMCMPIIATMRHVPGKHKKFWIK
jgi:hypothetical protein